MAIRVIITGGTIDGLDLDTPRRILDSKVSVIPNLLKQARISEKYILDLLLFKDSRLLTSNDRKLVYDKCRNCKESKILITHGTFTMPMTAEYLGKKRLQKTIILTGSQIPANKLNSDALFNLGYSFAALKTLKSGVYICMNAKIFSWKNVKKNISTNYFEAKH